MRYAFSFLLLPVLASCAFVPSEWFDNSRGFTEMHASARSYTILPPPAETVFAGSETVYQNNYVLNQTTTARVGQTVLRVQAFKKDNFIARELILEKPVEVEIEHQKIMLPAKKYQIFGLFELDGQTFFVLPKQGQFYLLVDMDGVIQQRFLYAVKGSDKVTLFSDKAKIIPSMSRMKRLSFFEQESVPFMDFEVVYDGIKNNQIILFYKDAVPGTNGGRGTFDTLAYPANSTMISVEGRLLRVIRADNESLTYIVVKE